MAPLTVAMLYVCAVPEQTADAPLMVAGCAGTAFTPTARVCAALVPQVLLAVTVMFPPVAPAVALIELVVDVPLHPPGNVHV